MKLIRLLKLVVFFTTIVIFFTLWLDCDFSISTYLDYFATNIFFNILIGLVFGIIFYFWTEGKDVSVLSGEEVKHE